MARMTLEELRRAVARGWCSPNNSSKIMDVDLAEAITQEVAKAIGLKANVYCRWSIYSQQKMFYCDNYEIENGILVFEKEGKKTIISPPYLIIQQ